MCLSAKYRTTMPYLEETGMASVGYFCSIYFSWNIVLAAQDLPDSPTLLKNETSLVIVFSYVRSGSTFVGELFRQNDEVFYIYEPLHPGHK